MGPKGHRRDRRSRGSKRGGSAAFEPVIDLHGLTRQEAVERIEHALDRALLQNRARIKIVHGIGSGAVKQAVHAYLSSARQVAEFHLDPANAGVTWVYL
jgi:DNA mismatch repair protein MutS2